MKAKNLLQLLTLKVASRHAVNRLPGLHTHHRGHRSEKVAEAHKALGAQFFIAKFEADHRLTHKGVIARNLVRPAHTGHFRAHGRRGTEIIKMTAIVESNTVEGCHRPQIDIV